MARILVQDSIGSKTLRLNLADELTVSATIALLQDRYEHLTNRSLSLLFGDIELNPDWTLGHLTHDKGITDKVPLDLTEKSSPPPKKPKKDPPSDPEETPDEDSDSTHSEVLDNTVLETLGSGGEDADQTAYDLLVAADIVPESERTSWIDQAVDQDRQLIDLFIEEEVVHPDTLLAILSTATGVDTIDLANENPSPEASECLRRQSALSLEALPLRFRKKHLIVASPNPFGEARHNAIRAACGHPVQLILCSRPALLSAIDAVYGNPSEIDSKNNQSAASALENELDELEALGFDSAEFERVSPTPSFDLENDTSPSNTPAPESVEMEEVYDGTGYEDDIHVDLSAPNDDSGVTEFDEDLLGELEAELEQEETPTPIRPSPTTSVRRPLSSESSSRSKPTRIRKKQNTRKKTSEEHRKRVAQKIADRDNETHLTRQATVRHNERMIPHKNVPLLVVLARRPLSTTPPPGTPSEDGLRAAQPSNSRVRVVPHFPGCLVVPPQTELDLNSPLAQARFWITPLAEGDLTDARVEIWQDQQPLQTIACPTVVSSLFLPKLFIGLSIAIPLALSILTGLGITLESLLPWILGWIAGGIGETILGWISFFGFAAAGTFLYIQRRPQESAPRTSFFDLPQSSSHPS
ncbi:MAG: hypothetical protein QF752_10100 [Planctomycetota bacterium]|jgi:hypothetical protein|nr:hypothetical protein [Planctomycetota bacterium]